MFVEATTNREYFAQLKEYCKHFSNIDNLIFTGYHQDVRDILGATDMLFLPSTEEGLPNAILEAMAMKLLVVATDVCGTRETIRDGANNPEILSQAMTDLIESKSKRQNMGEWGRKIAEEKFKQGRMVTHYKQLFRNHVR